MPHTLSKLPGRGGLLPTMCEGWYWCSAPQQRAKSVVESRLPATGRGLSGASRVQLRVFRDSLKCPQKMAPGRKRGPEIFQSDSKLTGDRQSHLRSIIPWGAVLTGSRFHLWSSALSPGSSSVTWQRNVIPPSLGGEWETRCLAELERGWFQENLSLCLSLSFLMSSGSPH
jgi:hypothetical protein